MRTKLAAIVAGAMMVGSVSANDIKMSPVFDISYLHSDANTAAAGLNQGQFINSRDDLDVQYAGMDFSGSNKELSWNLKVNFAGDTANTTSAAFINEATMTYAINDNISVTAGRFYSFFGYEGARNNGDWNYTKSISKTISPFWHEGIGATYDAKNGFSGSVFLVDGIANSQNSSTSGDQESEKGLGATVSYAMDKWKAEFDYYAAGSRTSTGDTTNMAFNFKYDISDKFSATVFAQQGQNDLTTASEWEYTSYAAYLKFVATEKLYFAARYEMFSEENNVTGGTLTYAETTVGGAATAANENDVDSITLTAAHMCGNGSEIKLEYRMDSSDANIYTHSDGTADDSNNTVALAWLYAY